MGKIFETTINRFDGGRSGDLRQPSSNSYSITKHFNIFSNPKRLTPYRDLEANETKNLKIVKFLQVNSNIYGYGVVVSGNVGKVYKKVGNIITSGWTEDRDVEGSGARDERVFFHYKDYIYMWEGGARLVRHGDITGTATNATFQTISFTDVAQPVHHPTDDIAYFFADNIVYSISQKDGSDWASVLTLPNSLIITSATPYGNYLAIACRDKNPTGSSIVFLWDRDSSLATVSEKIDWGSGGLELIGVIDGVLIGISNVGNDGTLGILAKLHIKQLSGNTAVLIREIDLDSTTTGDTDYSIPGVKSTRGSLGQVVNNKFYFALDSGDSVNARILTGIWVLGRHEAGSPFAITMAYKVDTDATSPTDTIDGFNLFQDYLFVAHSADGSVDRTNDQSSFLETSVFESQIYNGSQADPKIDSSWKKDLLGITVTFDPLPAAGQVVLKYAIDENIATDTFVTIFTEATNDSISFSAINSLPKGYKEIQFRFESTGGAEPTGLYFKEEATPKDRPYD